MPTMAKILASRLFPENGQENLRREIEQRWAQNDKNAYYNSLLAFKDWSVLNYLGEIRCPSLVIRRTRTTRLSATRSSM